MGIGDTTPTEGTLVVAGNVYASVPTGFGQNMCWDGSGDSVHGDCTSQRKYKTEIEGLYNGIELAKKLRPATFRWTGGAGTHQDAGFIADEVDRVFPRLANHDEDGVATGVSPLGLLAVAISAIQDLEARLSKTERELSELRRQLKGNG